MSMDRHTLQAVLEDQERHRDGIERRREERDAQRDAERTAHMTAMADKMAAMCLAIQNLVVAQAQAQVPVAAAGPVLPVPKIRLQKMTPEDDPEAFLTTFERMATVSGWPAGCWAAQLAPCLTGEAQAAYQALSNVAAEDYSQVKTAILRRLNITPETHCRRFRSYKRLEGTRPRIMAQQLWDHLTRWLRPTERTTQQIMESVAVDQFLEVLEPETRAWVARHSPETMDTAVELAEAFEDALLRVDPSPAPVRHRPSPAHPKTATRPSVFPVPLSASPPKWRQRLAPSWARENPWTSPSGPRDKQPSPTAPPSPTCFRCHEVGHIARFCPIAMECDVALRCPAAEGGVRVRQRPYRIPESRRGVMRREVASMLELGVVQPSQSEWCSPVVMVPKKDGSTRFCVDFRKVNAISKFDAYPMPRVDELLDRLGKARFLSTLDLTKGYWQIPLTPSSKEKTAFATPDGLFHFKTMPFGLHGAPATFQRLMDKVLCPHHQYAAAYIDDVVIFSSTWKEHLDRLAAVLQSLREAGLTVNLGKCAFGKQETQYLGFSMGNGRVKPVASKVQALVDTPVPRTKAQVRSLLGLAGYYRRFIPEFSTIVSPLIDLTKKSAPNTVKWSDECQEAFDMIKRILCQAPALVSPDFDREFILQTDASDVGLGAVLSQEIDGVEHPVLYISRKMAQRERNYSVIEKECLAIKWAMNSLRYYLLGRSFTLVTDHAPLKWLNTMRDTNARITRWSLALQPFNFTVKHRSGKEHQNADFFSREGGDLGELGLAECAYGSTLRGGMCDRTGRSPCRNLPSRPPCGALKLFCRVNKEYYKRLQDRDIGTNKECVLIN
ncbi:uncharacterized protein LOC121313985 [Polyodon spathula]|uniref:uncharacterized protein LOC121313985 n=1 Tax=Polyodon spathula TaxID=7913 RepID=UPI001B7E95F5|nr:uncharacterized protein LOC121313985 [Polyodon spathula]